MSTCWIFSHCPQGQAKPGPPLVPMYTPAQLCKQCLKLLPFLFGDGDLPSWRTPLWSVFFLVLLCAPFPAHFVVRLLGLSGPTIWWVDAQHSAELFGVLAALNLLRMRGHPNLQFVSENGGHWIIHLGVGLRPTFVPSTEYQDALCT